MKTEQERMREFEEKIKHDEENKLKELKEFKAKENVFLKLPIQEQEQLMEKAPKFMTMKQRYEFAVMNLPIEPKLSRRP